MRDRNFLTDTQVREMIRESRGRTIFLRYGIIAKGRRQKAEGLLLLRSRFGLYICPNLYDDSYTLNKILEDLSLALAKPLKSR